MSGRREGCSSSACYRKAKAGVGQVGCSETDLEAKPPGTRSPTTARASSGTAAAETTSTCATWQGGKRCGWAPPRAPAPTVKYHTGGRAPAEPTCPESKCTSGGGRFQIASSDGSKVFFLDGEKLTEDSGATG